MLSLTSDQKTQIKAAVKKMRDFGSPAAAKTVLDAVALLQNCRPELTLINVNIFIGEHNYDWPIVDIWVEDGIFQLRFMSYGVQSFNVAGHKRVSIWTTTKRSLSAKWVSKEEFALNTERYLLDSRISAFHKPSSLDRVRAFLLQGNATSGQLSA